MGMTILNAKQHLHEKWMKLTEDGTDEETMQALSIAETVLGDYDDSLKADMVAMLTEIQLEIEESENCGKAFHLGLQMASNIIQQKINALKGE